MKSAGNAAGLKVEQGSMLVVWRVAFAAVAIPVIQVMGGNNEYDSRYNEIIFPAVKKLLGKKKDEACRENHHRQ